MTQLQEDLKETGLSRRGAESIRAYFDRFVESGQLAGWLVTVDRGGTSAWMASGGHADRERATPVEPDTLWRLYSMTKPITAVAALMLYEEGAFDLNDEVGTWIEELREPRVYVEGPPSAMVTRPASEVLRVHHLFTHTAGFTYGFQNVSPVDAFYRGLGYDEISWKFPPGADLATAVRDWSSAPLLFEPGSSWNYSISIDVLGRLVEIWSGQRLDRFIAERILGPLQMSDTDWYCPPDKADRLAMLDVNYNGRAFPVEEIGRAFLSEPTLYFGGGGLVSTAHDFQRFTAMLSGGGSHDDVTLLTPRSVALLSRNHLPGGATIADVGRGVFPGDGVREGTGYGLGVAVVVDQAAHKSLMSEGTYSWGGSASTYFWIDPKEDLSVGFYAQLVPSTSHTWRRTLQQLVYSSMR